MEIYDCGITVTYRGKTRRLRFTEDEYWEDGSALYYSIIAVDDDGNEYCVTYAPPHLDPYGNENDCDYGQRCLEETNWDCP